MIQNNNNNKINPEIPDAQDDASSAQNETDTSQDAPDTIEVSQESRWS